MARPWPTRPLLLVVIILALVVLSNSMNCNVCLPKLTGDPVAIREARAMRANISREFQGAAESTFQSCGDAPDVNKPSTLACPWNDDSVVCLDIKHSSWQALTCGRVPVDHDMQCWECCGGALVCPCPYENCNSGNPAGAATPHVPVIGLLAATTLAIASAHRRL